MNEKRFHKRSLFLIAYLVFAVLPIYWMVNMSFKTRGCTRAPRCPWRRASGCRRSIAIRST